MPDDALLRKLLVQPGRTVLVLDAPPGLRQRLPASEGKPPVDVVLAFVGTQADVARTAPDALAALAPGGVLWLAYPKRSSKVETDLTRDRGWEAMWQAGWRVVSAISLDDTWSGLRFRPMA